MIRRWLNIAVVTILISCNGIGNKKDPGQNKSVSEPVYNEKTACLLSEIAYCPSPQKSLDKYLAGWKLVWDATEIDGNQVLVVTDGTTYAIAIRGSLIEFSWAAFQNWIYQDMNVASLEKWGFTDDSSKAKISEGAFKGFQNISRMVDKSNGKTLIEFLENATKEETPILVTGHSLGGNLATVYASWLWQHFKSSGHPRKNINVITFAAPAAGNESFADDFDKKFPNAERFENKNDIVPKFPCTSAVSGLGDLFDSTLQASRINVGYKNVTMPLNKVFDLLSTALMFLEFTNGNAVYKQPGGKGKQIMINLSGKNKSGDISSWLGEAGYQHGVARYSAQLGVPVVDCENK